MAPLRNAAAYKRGRVIKNVYRMMGSVPLSTVLFEFYFWSHSSVILVNSFRQLMDCESVFFGYMGLTFERRHEHNSLYVCYSFIHSSFITPKQHE